MAAALMGLLPAPIHGKGGNAEESVHYKSLFSDCDVVGLNYTAQFPWEAKKEFPPLFDLICKNYKSVQVIANSIGAYLAMNALSDKQIEKAYFVSPVVNMEKLITDMMFWANVTEDKLRDKKEIKTSFGETLSWEYLTFVRDNPINWTVPTEILYAGNDHLTSRNTVMEFVNKHNARLTVLENGEHWFHTEEQLAFLDKWLRNVINLNDPLH